MSAAKALIAARTVGVSVSLDGEDLVLEASAAPPLAVLDLLSRHKPGIVALLRPGADGWSTEDWWAFFDERAGILEYEGGLTRDLAEARAFSYCTAEWLNRNPERSGLCLGCGGESHDLLLQHDVESAGHAWLNSRCWPAWYANRKVEAVAALAVVGIVSGAEFPNDFGKNAGA